MDPAFLNEYIEWMVWDQPARSITDGTLSDFSVEYRIHSNALFAPDGSNVLSVATLGG
jgi:hypothetical protein